MVRNEQSRKSLAQAKSSSRQLAARVQPAPAPTPNEPRDLRASQPCQPKTPAGIGEPFGQTVDDGENAITQPYTVLMFHARDDALLSPKQGQGRARRRYEEQERLQVADTRRRGACKGCQASKTKCFHDPSKITTDQYQTHPQSHELFALGLTNPSRIANEDKHKQVMEEKIAALDDKLPKAQKTPPEQGAGANSDGGAKTAALRVQFLPPRVTNTKASSSQKRNYSAEVHQVPTQQMPPFQFQHCLKTLKLNDGRKQKPSSLRPPNKDGSKATADTTLGRKKPDTHTNSARRQPVVCQQPPIAGLSSTVATVEPAGRLLTPQCPNLQTNDASYTPTNPGDIRLGCISIQKSIIGAHLKTPNALPLKQKLESLTTRTLSDCSDHDSRTMTNDGSMLSFGRSPTPSSDHLPSDPPSFVHMRDLERSKSYYQVVPKSYTTSSEHLDHEQEILFEKLLYANSDDGIASVDDVMDPYPASESGDLGSVDSAAKMPFSELMDLE